MSRGARTAVTLTVLVVALVAAGAWGWSAMMQPFPGKVDTPLCEARDVEAGTKVFPPDVTVSVYNSSTRDGLAGRTMQQLRDQGFREGRSGNIKSRPPVRTAAIWTRDPRNPAVRLVASRLGQGVRVVRREAPGAGVAVVVGADFSKPVKGRKFVVAAKDTQICSPPVG
jgi:hypothetical protein